MIEREVAAFMDGCLFLDMASVKRSIISSVMQDATLIPLTGWGRVNTFTRLRFYLFASSHPYCNTFEVQRRYMPPHLNLGILEHECQEDILSSVIYFRIIVH